MKRKIIQVDVHLCNGCGQCVDFCPENALEIYNMKCIPAGDEYCSGCSRCVSVCPLKALSCDKETETLYDGNAVSKRLVMLQNKEHLPPLKNACTAARINSREIHPERFNKD